MPSRNDTYGGKTRLWVFIPLLARIDLGYQANSAFRRTTRGFI